MASDRIPARGFDRHRRTTLGASVTIDDVARRAGVSIATVSRVTNGVAGKVSARTRDRVLMAAEMLGYRPASAGSALRKGRSHVIGLLVSDPGNAHHAQVSISIERALRQAGKVMILANTGEDPATQDAMIAEMLALSASGIILLGAIKSAGLRAALDQQAPVIFVNRRSPFMEAAPFVGIDHAAAAAVMAGRFFDAGHRRVAVFHGPSRSDWISARARAFCDSFNARVTEVDAISCYAVTRSRMESAYQVATGLFAAPDAPRAVFCTTDEIAYGVARACAEAGLEPGLNVRISGFDGNPLNAYLAPWLESVVADHDDFGPYVVELLERLWQRIPGTGYPADAERLLPFRVQPASLLPHKNES
ncbi:LacI family DNA-binding transcriptional regulator [Szabonella alba]|uniref:LacI family DNA-binding transcriptional regulator n=1 Tax=Szabonella alba TaxID=2804194 RepID=A0A8K0Y289_9RHOB|nr:LacI family DNA-binding transcriptional regulator [Szabonella alba]MBL4919188.1 LacI family DNA-binding transcriptional regulator [Szabonella alba]